MARNTARISADGEAPLRAASSDQHSPAMAAALYAIRRHIDAGELLILLTGAPGTGKTHLLRTLASDAAMRGETSQLIDRGARLADQVEGAPDLLLVDEAQDMNAADRQRISERLSLSRKVSIVAVTDPGLLLLPRPLDELPWVRLPRLSPDDGAELAAHFCDEDVTLDDDAALRITILAHGTPAVIRALARGAGLEAHMEARTVVRLDDVNAAADRQFIVPRQDVEGSESAPVGADGMAPLHVMESAPPRPGKIINTATDAVPARSAANDSDAPAMAAPAETAPAFRHRFTGARVAAALMPFLLLAIGGWWLLDTPRQSSIADLASSARDVETISVDPVSLPMEMASAGLDQTAEPDQPTASVEVAPEELEMMATKTAPPRPLASLPPPRPAPAASRESRSAPEVDMAADPAAAPRLDLARARAPLPPSNAPVTLLASAPGPISSTVDLSPAALPGLSRAETSNETSDDALAAKATREARDVLRAVRN
ncbi:MAG: ATP-binding protein [Pacificimonas sp.]